MIFETKVCGIPCKVRVVSWERYAPANLSGPPERCYEAEGGYGEWEVCDLNERPALWLERKMTQEDRDRLDEEIFDRMESGSHG